MGLSDGGKRQAGPVCRLNRRSGYTVPPRAATDTASDPGSRGGRPESLDCGVVHRPIGGFGRAGSRKSRERAPGWAWLSGAYACIASESRDRRSIEPPPLPATLPDSASAVRARQGTLASPPARRSRGRRPTRGCSASVEAGVQVPPADMPVGDLCTLATSYPVVENEFYVVGSACSERLRPCGGSGRAARLRPQARGDRGARPVRAAKRVKEAVLACGPGVAVATGGEAPNDRLEWPRAPVRGGERGRAHGVRAPYC